MAGRKAAPMTEVPDFERSHEDACKEEGHVMHDGYCLRCPYIEEGDNAGTG